MKRSYLNHAVVAFVDLVDFLDEFIEVSELLHGGSQDGAIGNFHLYKPKKIKRKAKMNKSVLP